MEFINKIPEFLKINSNIKDIDEIKDINIENLFEDNVFSTLLYKIFIANRNKNPFIEEPIVKGIDYINFENFFD